MNIDGQTMSFDGMALARNPSGAPPNFVNPPSLNSALLSVGVSLIPISTLTLSLRLFANLKSPVGLGFDDGLCVFAWITASAGWLLIYTFVSKGTARHAWDVPLTILTDTYMKKQFAASLIGVCAAWAAKACILSLYVRVFGSVRWLRNTCYVMLVLTACNYLCGIGVWIAFFVPRPGTTWVTTELSKGPSSKLANLSIVTLGVSSVALDIVMFALPFPIVVNLKLNRKKKIRLILVFSVALSILAASCTSLVFRIQYSNREQGDLTWLSTKVIISSTVEQFGSIIFSCAPALSSFLTIASKSPFYAWLKSFPGPEQPVKQCTWHKSFERKQKAIQPDINGEASLLRDTLLPMTENDLSPARSLTSTHSDAEARVTSSMTNIKISTCIEVRSDPQQKGAG